MENEKETVEIIFTETGGKDVLYIEAPPFVEPCCIY